MSKVLESLKPSVTKARNLTYFGRYAESISEFSKIIACLEIEIAQVQDKLLIEEWNKLYNLMRDEREMAENMINILAGDFEAKVQQKDSKDNRSRVEVKYVN